MIAELRKIIAGITTHPHSDVKEKLEAQVGLVEKELDKRFDKITELMAEVEEQKEEIFDLKHQIRTVEKKENATLPDENLYDTQKNEVLKRMHRNLTLEELNTLEGEAKMLMRNGRQYAL